MAKSFTRRMTPGAAEPTEWLVIVGDACTVCYVRCHVPSEERVRVMLKIAKDIPILIGRP